MKPRSIARLLAAGVVAALLAGCGVQETHWIDPAGALPSVMPTQPSTGKIAWRQCRDIAAETLGEVPAQTDFSCGTVSVPQDWNAPDNGKTFDIALMRARSTSESSPAHRPSLLVNRGGPGAEGVAFAADLSRRLPTSITRTFDIVGFDPRGVGRSAPVSCISNADKDSLLGYEPDPVDQKAFNDYVAVNRRVVTECQRKYPDTLHLYNTEQTARDMEAIRIALEEDKLTYLGYSYGTLLGAVYAHLFPTKVRAFVLDGAVDPQQSMVASTEGQAAGFEKAYANFAAWCKAEKSQCPLGDARKAVTDAMTKARKTPVAGPDGRKATAGWVFTAVLSSLYSRDFWPLLSNALKALDGGNATPLFQLVDLSWERDPQRGYTNLIDANATVNCTDEDRSPTVDEVRRLQGEWRRKYPTFGASLAMGMLTCAVWPAKHDPYPIGAADGAPPILVVGTVGDPATPYEQTAKLARVLGTGRVLTWQGEGHTAYAQTDCITTAVDDYLLDLTVPPTGKTCPA